MQAQSSKRSDESLGPPRRGTPLGEIVCGLALLRIFAILALELAMNIVRFFVFLFQRNRHRERMRKLILTASACLFLFLAAGCAHNADQFGSDVPKGSPTSFKRQVYEVRWSIKTLADQSDAQRSLEEDLRSLATDPHWKANLLFDLRHLLLMEDARASLEWDLKALADPDHRRHGLKETLE